MPHYRLYALTPDGHIQSGRDIEAGSDPEAIDLARVEAEHKDIELWCARRRVAFVPKAKPISFLHGDPSCRAG